MTKSDIFLLSHINQSVVIKYWSRHSYRHAENKKKENENKQTKKHKISNHIALITLKIKIKINK